MNTRDKHQGASASPPMTVADTPPRYASDTLFSGSRIIVIEHAGREYRLSITASNKLILTA